MLTFALAGEIYGVDILKVREIRGWSSVTHIPQAPADVLGVLNLRGAIVPIIDLRARFGLEPGERTPVTVIIVLSVESGGRPRDVGLLVDSVSDVADVSDADMKEAPELSSRMDGGFLRGLASIGDRMVLVLNTDHLVTEASAMAA
jgi:purine-binding chemotaxis protein CheW